MENILKYGALSKSFRGITALDRVDLGIAKKQIVKVFSG